MAKLGLLVVRYPSVQRNESAHPLRYPCYLRRREDHCYFHGSPSSLRWLVAEGKGLSFQAIPRRTCLSESTSTHAVGVRLIALLRVMTLIGVLRSEGLVSLQYFSFHQRCNFLSHESRLGFRRPCDAIGAFVQYNPLAFFTLIILWLWLNALRPEDLVWLQQMLRALYGPMIETRRRKEFWVAVGFTLIIIYGFCRGYDNWCRFYRRIFLKF